MCEFVEIHFCQNYRIFSLTLKRVQKFIKLHKRYAWQIWTNFDVKSNISKNDNYYLVFLRKIRVDKLYLKIFPLFVYFQRIFRIRSLQIVGNNFKKGDLVIAFYDKLVKIAFFFQNWFIKLNKIKLYLLNKNWKKYGQT